MPKVEPVKVQQHIVAEFAVMRDDSGWSEPCDEHEERRFHELLDELCAPNGVVEGRDTAEVVARVDRHLRSCKWTFCAVIEVKSKREHRVIGQALSHPRDFKSFIPTAAWKAPIETVLQTYRYVLASAADAEARKELLRRRAAKEL